MNYSVVLIVIVVCLLCFFFVTYNSLVGLRNKVKEAYATMDVYLKKRFDLIPNLVAVVKAYAKHEADTLEEITRQRANATAFNAQVTSEANISNALMNVIAVAEKYPDLKANQNFLELQKQLVQIEDDIASARRYYNGSVREYNTKCETIPSNIVASLMHFKRMPSFEVSDDQRTTPNTQI